HEEHPHQQDQRSQEADQTPPAAAARSARDHLVAVALASGTVDAPHGPGSDPVAPTPSARPRPRSRPGGRTASSEAGTTGPGHQRLPPLASAAAPRKRAV